MVNLLGGFVVYGKHHDALPKHLTKKTKKALSTFFIFYRNLCVWLRLRLYSFGQAEYIFIYIVIACEVQLLKFIFLQIKL